MNVWDAIKGRLKPKRKQGQIDVPFLTTMKGGAVITDSEGREWRAHWSGDLVYLSWEDGMEQTTFNRDEFGKFIKDLTWATT
jgi:hypothetical protein